MRPSAIHAAAGAFLCSTTSGFQGILTCISLRNSGPLHASRVNDSGSGRRSPGYVSFDSGSDKPYIPTRGTKEDDEAWFAQQVQMAEQQRYGFGGSGGDRGTGGQPYNRFGSQQMRSQPRPSRTPTPTRRSTSRSSTAPRSSSRSPPRRRRETKPNIFNRSARSNESTTQRRSDDDYDDPWPTIGTPTEQSTNRNAANQRSADNNRNSRAPQAIASGSSATSSWFRGEGGSRSGPSPQGVQMPGSEQVSTPTQSMERLSGPRPVTRANAADPVSRAPVTPGDAMRADVTPGDVMSSGARSGDSGDSGGQDYQQQPRPKNSGGWFNDQLLQQQLERERQQDIEREFGRPGRDVDTGRGDGNKNAANGANRNRPSTGFPSLPQPIGAKANRRGLPSGTQGFSNAVAYVQSAIVGAFVGTWSIFPFTAFHYLVFSQYDYTSFAQWEWDLIAATVQASCFAVIYRYAMRLEPDNKWIQRKVTLAAVLLISVIRVTVPYECAAGKDQPLFCVESAPLYMLNDGMAAEIAMNAVEGLAMFGIVALAMSWLLERNAIAPYRGE